MTSHSHLDLANHVAALQHIARELVGAHGPWEDLVQGTMLTALERPPRVLSRAWLGRVLHHRALDHYRRRTAAQLERETLDEGDLGAEAIAQRLELHQRLVASMGRLPESYQRVLFLRYFEGKVPKQIAREIGLPVKTVKTRLGRALVRLRRALNQEFENSSGGWMAAILPLASSRTTTSGALARNAGLVNGLWIMLKKALVIGIAILGVVAVRQWRGGTPESELPQARLGPPQEALRSSRPAPLTGGMAEDPVEPDRMAVFKQLRTPLPDFGSLQVEVVDSSGRPLAGVGVGVHAPYQDNSLPRFSLGFVISDEQGLARIEEVPQGEVAIYGDYGNGPKLMIKAGQEARQRWQVHGIGVRGLVVDAKGRRVAGAEIWVTTGPGSFCPSWDGGHFMTRSDDSGQFFLSLAHNEASLGALANGYAPSDLVDLGSFKQSDDELEIRLELKQRGGAMEGVVLNASGEPQAGARIAVGLASGYNKGIQGAAQQANWNPRSMLSDEQGRFLFTGLNLGPCFVSVEAPGHAVMRTVAQIQAEYRTQLQVQLELPGMIKGIVRGLEGEPLKGVILRAFVATAEEELVDHFVAIGQFTYHGIFAYPYATSDEQGRYRLTGVPPGALRVFATKPRASRRPPHTSFLRDMPYDEISLQLMPGEQHAWNPILNFGRSIEGEVLFKDGMPVDGVYVQASSREPNHHRSVQTDENGRFRLTHLEDAAYSIRIQWWPRVMLANAGKLGAEDIRPGQAGLELVADFDETGLLVPGSVRCRVEDVGDRIRRVLSVELHSDNGLGYIADRVDDAFQFDEIEPGLHRLKVLSGEQVVLIGEWFEVPPATEVDVGVLRSQVAGEALLRLNRSEIDPGLDLDFNLYREGDHLNQVHARRAKEHRLENLTPGRYRLQISGRGLALDNAAFVVEAGHSTTVDLRPQAGLHVFLRLLLPEGARPEWVQLEIYDDLDVLRDYRRLTAHNFTDQVAMVLQAFPKGSFRISVRAEGGLRAEAHHEVFDLSANGMSSKPVEIELK